MGGVLKRVRSAVFRACLPLRACCLPVLSLTRTPGGRCLEFTAAFFEPVFEKCERGVYFIGLVSVGEPPVIKSECFRTCVL